MRGQRLLIVTLGVTILINLCSSIHTNTSETARNAPKRGRKGKNAQLESRLSEMAKEFGATSFEETSEESTSSNEDSHAPKQHVKRLISTENHQQEFEVYQGVMGRPGIDFPVLPSIPKTTFSCRNVKTSGYYADLETDCQVFHICADGRKISFLCPNGTIFRQSHLICDWWWTVDCSSSREQYDESAELLAHDRKVYHEDRSEALSKARAAQRDGGGKQSVVSYDKEYEVGASATVTSVSTEPNARVVGRTRASKKGKLYLTSPKPSPIKDISRDAQFSSEDFQGGSSMELAEQRGFHSYHTPPDFTYRQENTQQNSANHNVFSKSIPTQSPGTQTYEASSFSQNFPSSTEKFYRYQDVSTPAVLGQTTNPVPTTHRPPFFHSKQHLQPVGPTTHSRGRTLESQQFSQIQPEHLKQRDTLNTYKEQPRKRFPQPQTTTESHTNKPKYLRSKPTQQTSVNFGKEEQNNDDKYFSSTESERQQLAETGSFFGNRANQLDNVHLKIQATTSRPSRRRTTSNPPVTSTELPNDPYLDIGKIKPQASVDDVPQRGRAIVIPETGFGSSGSFSSSWEQGNSANYYDDVVNVPEVEDEEPFEDDVHPPSAEQFKDEDIFYLRSSTSEKSANVTTTAKPAVTQGVENEEFDAPVDLIGDFRLSELNSETLFGDSPIASTSKPPYNEHSSILIKSTTASSITSSTPMTTTEEVKSKIEQTVFLSTENRTASQTQDQYARIPAFSDEAPGLIRSNGTSPAGKIETFDETKYKFISSSTAIPTYEAEKLKALLDGENIEATAREEFESIKTKLQSTSPLPEKYGDGAKDFSQAISDVQVKEDITDSSYLNNNNTNEERNLYSTDKLEISVTSESPVTVDTTTKLVTRSKPQNLRKRFRNRTTTSSTNEANIQYTTEASTASSAGSPKRDKVKTLSPFLRTTTTSPPATVYVTLSRKVKPPVIILSATDPRETASSKIRESFRNRNKAEKSKTELDKSSTLPIDVDSTASIPAVNVSRRVQPPRYNSSALLSKRNKNQNTRVPTTPLPERLADSTVSPTLPVSTVKSPIELLSTSSSRHGRLYPSSTGVPSSKVRSTTEAAEIDSTTIKDDLEIRNLIRQTENIPQLKQESTSTSQYGNRVGLNIPPSSAPATLHSLAVYFASKENKEGSASTETVNTANSGKANLVVNSVISSSTSIPTPTTEVYITSANVDERENPPEFLTQAIKDSYSALFSKKKATTTTQTPTIATKVISKEREASGSVQNELRNQILDKLVEMSHMDKLPEAERNRTIELMRNMPHSDTEDLLQGTDSHDLRELAQIFSRALSAYLENPEGFKRVLNEIRPTEPPIVSEKGLESYNKNSVSSTITTELSSHEDDEVLHFSDVPNISLRKRISTTAVPVYKSSSSLPPAFADVNFLSESSTASSIISATLTGLGDVDIAPPSERLEKSESSYYSSKEEITTVPAEETSDISSSFNANDYSLPFDAKKSKESIDGLQTGSLSFVPTAGGVNDPTRPRYGGFQNNSKDLNRINEQENKNASTKLSEVSETVPATTFTPSIRYSAQAKEIVETTTEAKYTAIPEAIGNILATFAPEDLNNLAIADDENNHDAEEESSTVTSETTTISDALEESLLGANTASFGSSKQYHSNNYIKSNKKFNEPVNPVDAITINRELSESNINEKLIASNATHETSTVAELTGNAQQKENPQVYTTSEIKAAEFITSTLPYAAETSSYTETTEPAITTESQKSSGSVLHLTDSVNRTLQSSKSESASPSAASLIQTTHTGEYLSNRLQKESSEIYISASTSSSVIKDSQQANTYVPHHSVFSSINCSSFTKNTPDETTQLPESTTPEDTVKDTTEIVISLQSRYPFNTTTLITAEDNLEKDSSNEDPIAVHITTTESPYEQPSVTSSIVPLPEAFALRTENPITTTDLPASFAIETTNERILEGSSPKASVINSLSYSVTKQNGQQKKTKTNISPKLLTSTDTPTSSSVGGSTQQKINKTGPTFASTSKPETKDSNEPMTVDQIETLEHLQTMLFPTDAPIVEDGKVFGNLNESSTLLLINTMKQAITNSTVRRLVLLLVNSLKDGTPEETRDILIEALLRIPCERREVSASQYESFSVSKVQEKNSNTYSTTQLPVTTARISSRKVSITQPSLDKEETKTIVPVSAGTTNEENTSKNSSTVTERKNLSESASSGKVEDTLPKSDTRAVELLRSLYSLASRWG